MEAMDGGTTTIVDHAHMSKSPDHGNRPLPSQMLALDQ